MKKQVYINVKNKPDTESHFRMLLDLFKKALEEYQKTHPEAVKVDKTEKVSETVSIHDFEPVGLFAD